MLRTQLRLRGEQTAPGKYVRNAYAQRRNFASYYREMDEASMHRRAGLGGKGMGTPGLNLDQVLGRLQVSASVSHHNICLPAVSD